MAAHKNLDLGVKVRLLQRLRNLGVRERWRVPRDCKSLAFGLGGSNPPTPTNQQIIRSQRQRKLGLERTGIAQKTLYHFLEQNIIDDVLVNLLPQVRMLNNDALMEDDLLIYLGLQLSWKEHQIYNLTTQVQTLQGSP